MPAVGRLWPSVNNEELDGNDDFDIREASSVIEQSPAAMQLRYLQTLNSISSGFSRSLA